MIGSQSFIDEVVSKQVRGEGQGKGEMAGMRELARLRPEAVIKEVEWHFGIQGEEIKSRAQSYTEPRYLASYLLRRHCWMSLREIGERVGLHYSAVGNAIQRVRENPPRKVARSLKELELKLKNQET